MYVVRTKSGSCVRIDFVIETSSFLDSIHAGFSTVSWWYCSEGRSLRSDVRCSLSALLTTASLRSCHNDLTPAPETKASVIQLVSTNAYLSGSTSCGPACEFMRSWMRFCYCGGYNSGCDGSGAYGNCRDDSGGYGNCRHDSGGYGN